MKPNQYLFIDCDSTLSAIEGIDELGRFQSPEVFRKVEDLTNRAMNGEIPIADVFGLRLELIRPSREQLARMGEMYVERMLPGIKAALAALRKTGWYPVIVSGGFRQAIQPLADKLGIKEIEAVDLRFDANGDYAGFDTEFPTTRNGGKPEVIRRRLAQNPGAWAIMIGDGMSDLEACPPAEAFIAFTAVAKRQSVIAKAHACARSWDEIPLLVKLLAEKRRLTRH